MRKFEKQVKERLQKISEEKDEKIRKAQEE